MHEQAIKTVAKGEYVKRTATAKTVYIKTGYDRATKTFCLQSADDINKFIYIKPTKNVFVGFTY